ncbi:Hypothetical protein BRZCDTV_188, partial [Brazilian cedratvirus IHUMI]
MEEVCCLCSSRVDLIWARCLSSTCFFTDDWKSCKFREKVALKEHGVICSVCVNKHPHDEVLVTCDLCSTKYESIYGEYQGLHC